jgi:hypothetical protein
MPLMAITPKWKAIRLPSTFGGLLLIEGLVPFLESQVLQSSVLFWLIPRMSLVCQEIRCKDT